ncbi:MAG TPA: fatty acid desaturase family protein [Kaistia sp.]|nr:fatty acid desaturase family protein [Kaistia sp.]
MTAQDFSADYQKRDYSLVGFETQRAIERGLATAKWYRCPIGRKELKELMRRSDGPALRDTAIWFGALALSGFGGWYFWGSWASVPFFLVYGVLYGSASDSRWHECGHRTAFKTTWMNDVVYAIACFMILREPTVWRWSHTRHHTDTIIVGRDPEIAVPRPPDILGLILNIFALKSAWSLAKKLALHVQDKLDPEEATFIPEMERPKVFREARIMAAIFIGVAVWCVAIGSILPAMFIGLPSIYGGFMTIFFGLTQHAGLDEDVLDHRLNSRTIYMNPVFRFLYLNMNYHVEHHMFPMVPYHALPRLHEAIKDDCPTPYANCWEAYREIIPALLRQRREPGWYVKRQLPSHVAPLDVSAAGAAAAE